MDRKSHASLLRGVRKVHRATGIALFVLFLIIAFSGLFLGWKKNSNGYILPKTQKGISTDLANWMPMDSLRAIAQRSLLAADVGLDPELDRIDARPSKGIVKFTFTAHYWEVQLDATNGDLLSVALRRSDFLEALHDGSILDRSLKVDGGYIKLFYTSVMALALITFSLTGFWLWYGPRVMRRSK
ncbi:PepSY-associated TM helix domain-containing protein [Flavilitoribacter nigricans]|uniref:DNA mismatch repair protein n=1 Tax=Flavilitoribacter nigricans (strain ATCC 23147 / DSM 23189 / NBRC 102662 / NCIMB 1420 / SS-2) TaxID=1122177 RepID=A0A2D0NDI8_FLAN2|nr:PepSY-associated TM helix domain-containing protein [Flavilitoribacter nigricans]PHN06545.1 DNA mismatch repair protein [Flavilitoribacter nigricans DSM 23189 = NBRC 102662]